jgi:RHS repeat-associated protein
VPSLRLTVVTLLALLLAPLALAQFPSPINNDTRTPVPGSGHDYISMFSETVDPSNGSLSVHISTPVPPSRGVTIPFSFGYNSGGVQQVKVFGTSNGLTSAGWSVPTIGGVVLDSGGWSYRIPELTANQTQAICYINGGGGRTLTTNVWLDYIFTDPSGTRHNLGLANTETLNPDCSYVWNPAPYSVSSGGDDFYSASLNQMTGAVTVVGVDGTVYNFPSTYGGFYFPTAFLPTTIEDRNGNIVTISEGSSGNITQTDTAGRPAVSTSAPAGTNGTVSISGLSNAYTVTWETQGSAYGSQYEQLGEGSNDGCNWLAEGNGPSNIVIKSLGLPNGTYYSFGYDGYGLINQISYPTGAVVTYTWNTPSSPNGVIFFPDNHGNQTGCGYEYYAPMVMQRTVAFDGVHTALLQTFTYTTAYNTGVTQAIVQTTVYSSNGSTNLGTFKTVYNYAARDFDIPGPDDQVSVATSIPLEQTVQYYDYGQTNLLETVTKGWQDQFRLGCQLETIGGSGLRGTFYSYGPGLSLTDEKEYDYGQISSTSQCPQPAQVGPITAPAGATRETAATYQVVGNTSDRPCSVVTKDSNGNKAAETDYLYDGGTTVCGTAGTPSVATANKPIQHDPAYAYTASPQPPRGNATQKTQWASTGTSPVTTYTYDETGQVLQVTDPCGNPNGTCSDMSGTSHTTTYSFADNYSSGTPPGTTNTYLAKITDALGHSSSFAYGYSDGQLTSSTDPNSKTTYYTYNTPPSGCSFPDKLDRLSSIAYPDGGKTTYCYNDSSYNASTPSPSVTTTQAISSSVNKVTIVAFDGIGHTVETILPNDPSGSTYTATTYDGLGRPYTVSNPYRSTSDPTYGLTTFTYDALGRTCVVMPPGGTAVSTCPTTAPAGDTFTSYSGRATSVQDEGNGTAPVQRISQSDGLGRLTSVCEVTSATQLGPGGAPAACGQDISGTGFLTDYSYDVLGNLLTVSQGSLVQRTFAYDSLSRLLCAANPETGTATCPNPGTGSYTTGTTGYTYDANGNLSQRTRPAPNQTSASTTVATTYTYDALNRPTQKSYSDTVPTYTNGTPTVLYGYDQTSITMGSQQFSISNNVGRMSWSAPVSQAGYTISMNAFSYDPLGRTAELWQSNPVNSNNIFVSYGYDLLGDETNRNLNNSTYAATYNVIGQLTSFTSTDYTDSMNPANILTGAGYDPFGHLTAATFGNGLSQSWAYDNRGRPKAAAVGTTCSGGTCMGSTKYGYSVSYAGDGDILSATDTVNGQWAYTYDGFNRLLTSNCSATCPDGQSTQGFSYGYDRYGNRWNQTVTAGSGPQPSFSFTGAQNGGVPNNRIDGDSYDAAGNLLNDGTNSYTYDAENRIKSVNNGATTYTYDAEGRRVAKTTGASVTDFIYDREGHIILDTTPSPADSPLGELYVAGMHLGTYVVNSALTDTIFYYDHSDWLGTERARTNPSGVACETIQSLPFGDGQGINSTCGDVSPMHFTGKERDTESGLDEFGARHFASTMGRFMQADPFTVTPGRIVDPQQFNLYAYVRNNPLRHIDPTGMLIDDSACKADKNCAEKWQQVQDTANQKDKNGNYLHPELQKILSTLQGDSRTFALENSKLSPGTAGQFTITNFTADGKDFTRATLQLDFKQIQGISNVTGADLVPGFNKYQGLLNAPIDRLAETFGHEGAHGLFSIENPSQAVGIQQLLNQRDAAMEGQHYPYPPDVMQKIDAAAKGLIPTETFAQQEEKIVNGELQADKKKQ